MSVIGYLTATRSKHGIKVYNSRKVVIYSQDCDGYETWFDEKGNEIRARIDGTTQLWYDSNGYEITKSEFDQIYKNKK